MRALIQRVSQAEVAIAGRTKSSIGHGMLVLAGFEEADSDEDLRWMAAKLTGLRIFDDQNGVMNCSLRDVNGEALIVSQFTLWAQTRKGNRPSYMRAAKPETALPLYHKFIACFENLLGKKVGTGEFGADMQVALVNSGPVTIWLDTKNKE